MKNKLLYFALGVFSSIIITYSYNYYSSNKSFKNNHYFRLNKDYKIGELGILKKGTQIKFDEGMSEGFDRFILYLNVKGGDLSKESEIDVIIPYWLHEISVNDSTK